MADVNDEQDQAPEVGEQIEAFPLGAVDGDAKVSLKTLIKPGEPVTYTCSMRSAEVPLRGGLVNPRTTGRLLMTYEAFDGGLPVPERDDDTRQVVGWKVRQQLRPVYVEPVEGDLPEMVEAWFDRVMEESAEVGGALADRIAAKAAARLSVA
jgi:hypothetical protein